MILHAEVLKAVEQGGLLLSPSHAIVMSPPAEAHAREGGTSTLRANQRAFGECKAEVSSIKSVEFVAKEDFDVKPEVEPEI